MSEERAKEVLRKEGMSEQEIEEFLDGCKKGIQAYKEGRVKSWEQVKEELGL